MIDQTRRAVVVSFAFVLTLQAGCGTIFYPERRGQRGGRLDAGVAVMDGIGLLFFIIPGVIAFCVDFGDGAIYLPGTGRGPLTLNGLRRVNFGSRRASAAEIERLVRENTGVAVKLDGKAVQFVELDTKDEMVARFAAAGSEGVASVR